ncbi:MAG: hypothetical protein QOD04_5590, partial [Pseudonocardiales bacterium]|nr:hypothetical protein [Pseudonocardiales bacterium]
MGTEVADGAGRTGLGALSTEQFPTAGHWAERLVFDWR